MMERDLSGIKVLVIDDSKTIRSTADALLKKTGCDVVTATDGFDALSMIVQEKPDIIFIDVMMPRLNGYETCSIIRSNQEYSETPIVMLSSKSSFCDKAKGDVVGANAYLTKPFARDELLDVVSKFAVADEKQKAVAV
jgi:twitching motility two-component system response regulator PilG